MLQKIYVCASYCQTDSYRAHLIRNVYTLLDFESWRGILNCPCKFVLFFYMNLTENCGQKLNK